MKIIDVSHWQDSNESKYIDWKKVRKAGVDVAIIKCTQGTGMLDDEFAYNKKEARANGILLGYYHFANGSDAIKEADWFLKNVGDIKEGEFIALDWEIEHSNPDNWCKDWLDRVLSKVGFRPLLYTNADRVKRADWKKVAGANYGLWIARYGDNDDKAEDNEIPDTDEWKFFAIWQFSSTGSIDGIKGRVDLDTTTMDLPTLKKYGKPAEDAQSTPGNDYSENLYKIYGAVQDFLGRNDGENPNDDETAEIIKDLSERGNLEKQNVDALNEANGKLKKILEFLQGK